MPQINKKQAFCHKLIKQTAREMAGAIYEESAKNNEWYEKYPDQMAYIHDTWPLLLEEARGTLARLLATSLPDSMKTEISEALVLDNTVRGDRATTKWSN